MIKFKAFLDYSVKILFVLSSTFVLTLGLLFLTNPALFQLNNIQIITPQVIVIGSNAYNEDYEDEEEVDEEEVECVKQALWHEARGEGIAGIEAVASVIVNRVNSKRYPNSFCEVIHQPMQFSYVHERQKKGLPLRVKPKESEIHVFEQVNELAHEVVAGQFKPIFDQSVLWYAHQRINNYWTKKKAVVAKVGNHVFYKINS